MKSITTQEPAQLEWSVFVAEAKPTVTDDLPPGAKQRMWSPTSATLISGERDAVLVDPLMTVAEARRLADWVAAKGKQLTMIYVTHGHGDHFFGASIILERFPNARVLASPPVVAQMRTQIAPQTMQGFWNARFPGQIPERVVIADPLDGNMMELEGHQLVVVDLGHTDTQNTTCLHVPSIGLVVAGDAAYNDVHLYLAESNPQRRREWIAALDTIEALRPCAVIAGHKRPGNEDNPRIIEETRQYIRDFDRIAETAKTTRELFDQVLAIYPLRVNPGALWSSARALKG